MPITGTAPNKTYTRTDGTRTGTNTWAQADAAGVDILSADHDTHDEDMATALRTMWMRDGGNQPTADIPFGGYKATGVGGVDFSTATITGTATATGAWSFSGTVDITGALTASSTVDFTGTEAVKIPVGTTAQRPGTPSTGDLRFNSTDTAAEIYDGSAWAAVGGRGSAKAWANIAVSGGTPSAFGSFNVSSLTDDGVGDTNYNFATALSAADVGPSVGSEASTGDRTVFSRQESATHYRTLVKTLAGSASDDNCNSCCFGDLA